MDMSEIRAAVFALRDMDAESRLFMELLLYTEFIEDLAKEGPERWARLAKEVLKSKGSSG